MTANKLIGFKHRGLPPLGDLDRFNLFAEEAVLYRVSSATPTHPDPLAIYRLTELIEDGWDGSK